MPQQGRLSATLCGWPKWRAFLCEPAIPTVTSYQPICPLCCWLLRKRALFDPQPIACDCTLRSSIFSQRGL